MIVDLGEIAKLLRAGDAAIRRPVNPDFRSCVLNPPAETSREHRRPRIGLIDKIDLQIERADHGEPAGMDPAIQKKGQAAGDLERVEAALEKIAPPGIAGGIRQDSDLRTCPWSGLRRRPDAAFRTTGPARQCHGAIGGDGVSLKHAADDSHGKRRLKPGRRANDLPPDSVNELEGGQRLGRTRQQPPHQFGFARRA